MLYKRGEIWWVKFKAQGETIRRSTGTTKRRQAEIYERDMLLLTYFRNNEVVNR